VRKISKVGRCFSCSVLLKYYVTYFPFKNYNKEVIMMMIVTMMLMRRRWYIMVELLSDDVDNYSYGKNDGDDDCDGVVHHGIGDACVVDGVDCDDDDDDDDTE
jgi:hypothetical protein